MRFGASLFASEDLYYGHGTDNSVDEALTLVLHALHLQPGVPTEFWQSRLTSLEKQAIAHCFAERVERRTPVPYITGQAWFAGLSFRVDSRVLIPRSPIAELIEAGFEPWLSERAPARILDLCTGSGCIAIACALAFPDASVDASDVSIQALDVAQSNVDDYALGGQIRLIQTDLFDGVESDYDLIVSNPPYVPDADMAALPAEYRHEPAHALAAGPDGLDLVSQMLAQAGAHLAPEALLVVEVGVARAALEHRYPDLPFVWPEFERGGDAVFMLEAAQLPIAC